MNHEGARLLVGFHHADLTTFWTGLLIGHPRGLERRRFLQRSLGQCLGRSHRHLLHRVKAHVQARARLPERASNDNFPPLLGQPTDCLNIFFAQLPCCHLRSILELPQNCSPAFPRPSLPPTPIPCKAGPALDLLFGTKTALSAIQLSRRMSPPTGVGEPNRTARMARILHSLKSQRRTRWRRTTLCLGSIATAFLMAEIVARIWLYSFAPPDVYPLYAVASEFPEAAKYAPHHYFGYRLQPNYQRGETSHNSLGYRGSEITVPKPQGMYRIAVLGGSTTYGEFIENNDQTFPAQLEEMLKRVPGVESVEVVNAGVPGYSSWESLVDLEFRVLDLEPDLVIVYSSVNDVHCRLVAPEAYRGDNSGRRTIWREPIEVTLCRHSVLSRVIGSRLGLWRNPGVDSYVQAETSDPGCGEISESLGVDSMTALDRNGTEFFERNLRSTIAVCEASGAKVMLATWASSAAIGDYIATPHYQRGVRELNEVILKVGQETGVATFHFAAVMPPDPVYWRDGRHVNARGAGLQAAAFARFLQEREVLNARTAPTFAN